MPTKTKPRKPVITADWLKQFCGGADHRWTIDSPWTSNGRTYATDRYIAIRLDSAVAGVSPPPEQMPNVDAILTYIADVTGWCEVPRVKCKCDKETCIFCDEGIWKCNCPSCGVKHVCAKCNGTGKVAKTCHCTVKVLNRDLSVAEIEKLRGLPEIECGAVNNDPGNMVYFRFDGGVAALMPMVDRYVL